MVIEPFVTSDAARPIVSARKAAEIVATNKP